MVHELGARSIHPLVRKRKPVKSLLIRGLGRGHFFCEEAGRAVDEGASELGGEITWVVPSQRELCRTVDST